MIWIFSLYFNLLLYHNRLNAEGDKNLFSIKPYLKEIKYKTISLFIYSNFVLKNKITFK